MIKLYHGTNTEFTNIDLTLCKPNKDFGRGFYLTDIRNQAVDMARRRTIIACGSPIVHTFLFDDSVIASGELSVKIFDGVSEEWANFIIENRKRRGGTHNYDVVIGPIADDGVVMQIDRYLNRMIDMPTLIKELTLRKLNRQYYFGTERSLKYLKRI